MEYVETCVCVGGFNHVWSYWCVGDGRLQQSTAQITVHASEHCGETRFVLGNIPGGDGHLHSDRQNPYLGARVRVPCCRKSCWKKRVDCKSTTLNLPFVKDQLRLLLSICDQETEKPTFQGTMCWDCGMSENNLSMRSFAFTHLGAMAQKTLQLYLEQPASLSMIQTVEDLEAAFEEWTQIPNHLNNRVSNRMFDPERVGRHS